MASRESPAARGRRLAQADLHDLVKELRDARIQAGLSQEALATAAGLSRHALGRVERLGATHVDLDDLAAIAAALGLDLRVTTHPAGDPLRTGIQARMLAAFRARLPADVGWGSEVPLPISGDRRAWDATVIGADGWTGIEAVSRVGAADATVRRIQLKQRDDPRVAVAVLVILDSQRNRAALRAALDVVRAAFPLGTREVLAALEAGRTPRLNGIVLLRPAPKAAEPPRATAKAAEPPRAIGPQVVHSGGKAGDDGGRRRPKFVDKPIGAREPGP